MIEENFTTSTDMFQSFKRRFSKKSRSKGSAGKGTRSSNSVGNGAVSTIPIPHPPSPSTIPVYPEGHLEMTPIYMFEHFVSLFKKYLFNRSSMVYVPPQKETYWDGPIWGPEITHIKTVLDEYRNNVEKYGVHFASGRSMAWISNSGNLASCLAEFLLGQIDVLQDNSEVANSIEKVVIRWMCEIVGYPLGSDGYLASGGSMASVIAMAAARDYRELKSADYDKQVVYITARTHTALDKALETVGLGMCQLRVVPHDDQKRMIPDELQKLIDEDVQRKLTPFVIVATTGTTDLCSIDPIPEIAVIAKKAKVWFHVDGAIGAFYALSPKVAHIFQGMETADSIILDPHKSLGQPYGSGGVVFKKAVYKTISLGKDPVSSAAPNWQSPLENTMMFRSFSIWFSVQAFGIKTFRSIVERNIELARYAYDQLNAIDELYVMEPQLCTTVFRMAGKDKKETNLKTAELFDAMSREQKVFVSATEMDGFQYIRVGVTNYRENLSQMYLCLDEIYDQLDKMLDKTIKRNRQSTSVDLAWLEKVEQDLRWMEFNVATEYIDRFMRIVFDNVVHESQQDKNSTAFDLDALQDNLLYLSEDPVDIEKLLTIVYAMTLKGVKKPKCRYAGALGHLVSAVNNHVPALYDWSPGAVELEGKIIGILAANFGMSGQKGVLSSDICTSTELAFISARRYKFVEDRAHKGVVDGWDTTPHVLNSQLFAKAVVFTTEAGYTKFDTELNLVGLGECEKMLVRNGEDGLGAMDAENLQKCIEDKKAEGKIPWMVIQPVDGGWSRKNVKAVTDVCVENDVWHHVEVGPGTASRLLKLPITPQTPMDTHSVSVNLGPNLSLPVGVAAVMVKNYTLLYRSMTHHRCPEYLPETSLRFQSENYSFELCRPCRVTPLWFALRMMGTDIACEDI